MPIGQFYFRLRLVPRSFAFVMALALNVFGLPTQGAAADTQKRNFAVEAADAAEALEKFSATTSTPVVYVVEQVRGIRTNAVNGLYTVSEALERMVANTGLAVARDRQSGTLAVTRVTAPPARRVSEERNSPAPAPAGTTAQEEAVELSPFVVQESGDTGYLAQNSLSGSRLNTRLKDVSSPVTVFTEAFLADVAVTDLEELLEYAPNVAFEREEETNDTVGQHNEPFNYRIRGLPSNGRAYNYFRWVLDQDLYNVGRVDFSRGPNSILF